MWSFFFLVLNGKEICSDLDCSKTMHYSKTVHYFVTLLSFPLVRCEVILWLLFLLDFIIQVKTGLTYHAYNLFCDRLLGMVALTQQRETPLKIFIRLSLEPFKATPWMLSLKQWWKTYSMSCCSQEHLSFSPIPGWQKDFTHSVAKWCSSLDF